MEGILDAFPELMGLGQQRLQSLCDKWKSGPIAKEFNIADVRVSSDCRRLDPVIGLFPTINQKGDIVHFPADRLVMFLIDYGCEAEARPALKARLIELRQRAGVEVYQRYETNVPAYTLGISCPHCQHKLLTQMRVFKNQPIDLSTIEEIDCPRCRKSFQPRQHDFFAVNDPDYGKATGLE